MMELDNELSEYSSLTIYEAAFMLAVDADPVAHNYRCQCDSEYEDYFSGRQDTQELISEKCNILMRAVIAEDIVIVKEKHRTNCGSLDFNKTFITTKSFIEWCKQHHYHEIVSAFNNATKKSNAVFSCVPDQSAHVESPDWRVSARKFADEFFDNDTKNNCRDSLHGYSVRVMNEMQSQKIHGPRGRIDNPLTIQREALQASKWWAKKQK